MEPTSLKKRDTCTNIQRSIKQLRVSMMLLGASNNIMLPGDCTSRGGGILCRLVVDGEKTLWKSYCSQAGSWKLGTIKAHCGHHPALIDAWFGLNMDRCLSTCSGWQIGNEWDWFSLSFHSVLVCEVLSCLHEIVFGVFVRWMEYHWSQYQIDDLFIGCPLPSVVVCYKPQGCHSFDSSQYCVSLRLSGARL